tara:strand:+ start:479 stop:1132 length:654 start_codon:yes stop_codon:yes gene_type:complete
MTTYGTMQTRIASDLERTLADTSFASRTWADEIKGAINDAIKLYRSKSWWFLQEPNTVSGSKTSTTTASNSYVADVTGLVQLVSLRITVSSQTFMLTPITIQEMESRHDGTTSTNAPYEYCRYGSRVRLYPTPDDTYTLTWTGTFEEGSLSADADTNDWMTHGELVVRAMAKLILLRDYIKSYDDMQAAASAVQVAEAALDREHAKRTATRRMQARW